MQRQVIGKGMNARKVAPGEDTVSLAASTGATSMVGYAPRPGRRRYAFFF